MNSGMLAQPGHKLGPCIDTCEHADCKASRAFAAKVCRHCGKRIGYEILFYRDEHEERYPYQRLVHADCHEGQIIQSS